MKLTSLTLLAALLMAGCGGSAPQEQTPSPENPPAVEQPPVVTPPAVEQPPVVTPPATPPVVEQPPVVVTPPVVTPPVVTPPPPVEPPPVITPPPPPPVEPPPVTPILPVGFTDQTKFTLTFQDEFSGTALDMSKWNDQNFYGAPTTKSNYGVENGVLKMWIAKPFTKENVTITTDGKFEQKYGYFEARMKLLKGKAAWPAFWLYSHVGNDRPEIDIMEAYPGGGPDSWWSTSDLRPNNYGITLHKANADYSWHVSPFATTMRNFSPWDSNPIDLSAAFHVYAVDWQSDGIQFYFDGKPIGPRYTDSDFYFSKNMYVLLDVWLGSASGSPDSTTITGKSNSLQVDYVRVWQHK